MSELLRKLRGIEESSQKFSGKQLFSPADPQQQIRAGLISVRSALGIQSEGRIEVNAQKKAKLEALADTLETAYSSTACRDNAEIARRAVVVTGALLSSAYIDEMDHNADHRLFGRSRYGREKGIQIGSSPQGVIDVNFGRLPLLDKQHFMTARELESLMDRNQKSSSYIKVKTIKEFEKQFAKHPEARIIFVKPISYKDIVKMLRITRKNIPGQIVVPVRLNNRAGALLTFRKEDATQYNYVGLISELPRQEVWRASLEAGVPVYRDRSVIPTQKPEFADAAPAKVSEQLEELVRHHRYETMSPAESMEARKTAMVAQIILDGNEEKLEAFNKRNEEFYRRNYGFEHPVFGQAEMTLTRSGASANETAIFALAWYTNRQPKTYALPGWYYENRHSLDYIFDEVSDPKDARAFFINAEPNVPVKSLLGGKDYHKTRDLLIADVVNRARKSPNEEYYMVLDKTTDMNWKPFVHYTDLPKNLIIIETASLTKHQRGERKHFFGAMWTYGPKNLQKFIEDSLVYTRGTLAIDNIVHVPRITPSEIQRNIEVIKEKQAVFSRGFIEGMGDMPEEYRWELENHNYFTYLMPPYNTIFKRFYELRPHEKGEQLVEQPQDTRIFSDKTELGEMEKTEEIDDPLLRRYLKIYADTSVEMAVRSLYGDGEPYPEGMMWGDSFGLNSTRLTAIKQFIYNSFQGKYLFFSTSRFSFGYKTPENILYERGKILGEAIAARMKRLEERTNIDDLQKKEN